MADVNDMFNDITKEQSYYKPKAKVEMTPYAEGDYLCHIVEVSTKMLDVQGKYKAQLYSFTVEVADENKSQDFQYTGIDGKKVATKGTPYVGKKFFGKLWRFVEPKEGDTFVSNSEGNSGYLRFCETIGVDCPKVPKNIDGQDVDIQVLPKLSSEDLLGKPVTAFIALGKPWTNKKGERKQYYECKFCKKWDGGNQKTITGGSANDIPF